MGPLRQIDSVVIDSSAFSKVKGDVYRLSLTLKNTAPIDLAMPAVELSLTDTWIVRWCGGFFGPRNWASGRA